MSAQAASRGAGPSALFVVFFKRFFSILRELASIFIDHFRAKCAVHYRKMPLSPALIGHFSVAVPFSDWIHFDKFSVIFQSFFDHLTEILGVKLFFCSKKRKK